MGSETVVIGLNWVGDNILALPTYRALQHRFRSEGGIAVAAPEHIATLLSSSGVFRKVILWNGSTAQRIRSLKDGRFRRAIILPNSFRAAMVAYAAGIGERWGYATDCRSFLLTHQVKRELPRGHQLDDYTALLAAMNAPRVVDEIPTITLPSALREKARRRLRTLGIKLDRPLFGIHAGGLYGPAKHWGNRRYCEVAERLRGDGYDVVLLTSPGERQQASVSIFGPTDPGRTVIPGASRVLSKPFACQPCYERECPLGDHRCMTQITVDDVYGAVVGLFAEIEGKLESSGEVRVL